MGHATQASFETNCTQPSRGSTEAASLLECYSNRTMHHHTLVKLEWSLLPNWAMNRFRTQPTHQTLPPVTFFLFPQAKEELRGRCFESRHALGSGIFQCLNRWSQVQWSYGIQQLPDRWTKCIRARGDYFEGEIWCDVFSFNSRKLLNALHTCCWRC